MALSNIRILWWLTTRVTVSSLWIYLINRLTMKKCWHKVLGSYWMKRRCIFRRGVKELTMTILTFIWTIRRVVYHCWMRILMICSKICIWGILVCFRRNILFIMMLMVKCNFKFWIYIIFSNKESRKVLTKQKGVVRTNCLDCLDRTNVFQAKICLKVFEDLLRSDFNDPNLTKLML